MGSSGVSENKRLWLAATFGRVARVRARGCNRISIVSQRSCAIDYIIFPPVGRRSGLFRGKELLLFFVIKAMPLADFERDLISLCSCRFRGN